MRSTQKIPAEPLGLDAELEGVTWATIRKTLRGVRGSGSGMDRTRLRDGVAREIARLEAEAAPLRAWMRREEQV